jgi:NAD+ synthase (glutamine-hydrolysing)
MRIALAQINPVIGDFERNFAVINEFTFRAYEELKADIVFFPELSVCGYPPMDLLDQNCFTELNIQTVCRLQRSLPKNIAAGIGFVNKTPYSHGKSLVNEYGIIRNGELVFEQVKTLLPTYDVFDEARNFEPSQSWNVYELDDSRERKQPVGKEPVRLGITICEDVWRETDIQGTSYLQDPVSMLLKQGISVLAVPSASPFTAGKLQVRQELAKRIALRGSAAVVYINAVGANDSIIFDGRSFVMSAAGQIIAESKAFEEDLIAAEV